MTSEELNASPIERDDASTSELNITQELSLPSDFDESLCMSLYKELATSQKQANPEKLNEDSSLASNCPSQKQDDLERKLEELLSANLELKEKGRLYDSLRKKSKANEAELQDLRSKLKESTTREKKLQHESQDYKRKVKFTGLELEHSKKECETYLLRAEKAEQELEECAKELKITQQQMDDTKAHSELEICRLREDNKREVEALKDAAARESKVLCEARDQALDQTKALQDELGELRSDRVSNELEQADIIKELEIQISDARAELKVKGSNLNMMKVVQDKTTAEATKYQDKAENYRESLSHLRQECARLEEAIRSKDELLSAYQHDDLLVDCDDNNILSNSSAGYLAPGRQALVKNSVALARKCRQLQSQLQTKANALATEQERVKALSMREKNNQQLFKELSVQSNKNASSYIISTLRARDEELQKQSTRVSALKTQLNIVVQEKRLISSTLSQVLERRDQLEEVKSLVLAMKTDVHTTPSRAMRVDGLEEDDMMEHVVHHRTKKR